MIYKEWIKNGGNKMPHFIESWLMLEMNTTKEKELKNSKLKDLFVLGKAGISTFREMKKFVDNEDKDVNPDLKEFIRSNSHQKYGQVLERKTITVKD